MGALMYFCNVQREDDVVLLAAAARHVVAASKSEGGTSLCDATCSVAACMTHVQLWAMSGQVYLRGACMRAALDHYNEAST